MLFSPTQHPQLKTILVLTLTDASYTEVGTFAGDDPIQSPQFGTLNLTPAQIFAAGDSLT
ncbi:MAG: hypothetical protein NW224_19240 [Leptolyngbyaceae cyanobacterium bins.302]|nr:hypothetical protein [Leptolyngbyaceae cyanobacterium bins.302]